MKKVVKHKLQSENEIALDFAQKVYIKFKDVIKAIVLFGSVAKKEETIKSDIDIIIFIDDCVINWDQELIAWYREELSKLLLKQPYNERLHINTVTLSVFWEELKSGEPLIINVLRYGEVLIDVGGFFDPLKVLLAKGKIKPTPEAVFTAMERAENSLMNSRKHILDAVEGFYWAMVDAAHALLMAEKITPQSPNFLSDLLIEQYVNTRRLDKKYVTWFKEVQDLAKKISYGDVRALDAHTIEDLHIKSEKFVATLRELTRILIRNEKIIKPEFKTISS